VRLNQAVANSATANELVRPCVAARFFAELRGGTVLA
jgi:hypothetical protein